MKLLTQLKRTLSQHLTWHKQRIDCFANIILSMIQGSTVSLHKLAQGFQSEAKTLSSFRRIQRFLKEQSIEQNQLVDLILSLLNMSDNLTLTIDRTNWKFGKKEINFLVLGAVHEGLTVPLYWIELDKKGNGSTEEHIEIIQKFIDHLGSARAECLLADREFIGNELFKYLESNGIDFCIRLRESQNISHRNGGKIKLKNHLSKLEHNMVTTFANKIKGIRMQITAKRLEKGDLLILASPVGYDIAQIDIYAERWSIERSFLSMKTHGFNIEDTHLKCQTKLIKMFSIVVLSLIICIGMGKIKNFARKIPVKNHGRKLYSIFSYGFNLMQSILKKNNPTKFIIKLFEYFFEQKPISKRLAMVTVMY